MFTVLARAGGASEPFYGPASTRSLRAVWSPDSACIAPTLGNRSAYHSIFAYSLAEGQSWPITDGLSDATEPVFDASGKYLSFFASTDAGPVNQWFARSNWLPEITVHKLRVGKGRIDLRLWRDGERPGMRCLRSRGT